MVWLDAPGPQGESIWVQTPRGLKGLRADGTKGGGTEGQRNDEKPILFGHSDGGSIALLYAAMYPQAVSGVVAVAPHIFVDDITLAHIGRARQAYLETDLPQRLARHHADPDSAFWGWNQVWFDPAFAQWNIEAYLPSVRCPLLAIQGLDDEYGTLEQIRGIQRHAPQTRLLMLPDCGHSPHKDQPGIVIQAVAEFVGGMKHRG
jgi:pimeloyl-ACP methyl ester carboxylesterase